MPVEIVIVWPIYNMLIFEQQGETGSMPVCVQIVGERPQFAHKMK